MPISEKVKALIRSAWDDGAPCLLATQGPNGPNVSPKGSMLVFDDDHLAYWEHSKKQALENLGHDKRVCVIYANFKAQRDGVLDSGFLRFYGKAELHESGPIRDNIFNLLLPREQTHVGADTGIGVLIKIERAADEQCPPLTQSGHEPLRIGAVQSDPRNPFRRSQILAVMGSLEAIVGIVPRQGAGNATARFPYRNCCFEHRAACGARAAVG
jgi:hypothetical protein